MSTFLYFVTYYLKSPFVRSLLPSFVFSQTVYNYLLLCIACFAFTPLSAQSNKPLIVKPQNVNILDLQAQKPIVITPKKVDIFQHIKPTQKEVLIVPEKVNLFAMVNPQKITLRPVVINKAIKAPFELPAAENINVQIPQFAEGIQFCGLQIPMNVMSVLNRLKSEIARCIRGKYSLIYYQQRAQKYQAEIQATLEAHDLPKELFYLSVAESGLANVTSPKGAKGFWQFMPATAQRYGLEVSQTVDERLHPQKSCVAACQYLQFLYGKFHNWALAAAAYNMGEGGVENALQNQGKSDYFSLQLNPETAQYVYRIVALKYVLEHPTSFNLPTAKVENYKTTPFRTEDVDYDIPDLKVFAEDCGTDYASLKAMNPWLIADKLDKKAGKKYEIRLPVEGSIGEEELLDR